MSAQAASIAATRWLSGAVSDTQLGAELQALAEAQHRDAVEADRAGDDHHVAGSGALGPDVDALGQQADAGGVDEQAVGRHRG